MEMQSIQDRLDKIQHEEQAKTVSFINSQFGRNSRVLDISNKYLVKDTYDLFKKSLSNHVKNFNTYNSLILQNCLLTNSILIKLLSAISKLKIRHLITSLDLANNQIELSEKLSQKISDFFESSSKSKGIRLILQGNIVVSHSAISILMNTSRNIKELSLYDTRLSVEALLSLSEFLAKNKTISKLDLSYNPEAFKNAEIVHHLGISIGINSEIEYLNLSGNTPLHRDIILIKLLSGIANNKSLTDLVLGNLNFKDRAIEIICKILFPHMPLMGLDLQSNMITWKGLDLLLSSLPDFMTSLDVSYNSFKSNAVLSALGRNFKANRMLRKLNVSYSIELRSVESEALQEFCAGITENISLNELWCEGIKIGEDPDEFCSKVGEAIANRKYSLTFKISAVNCFSGSQNTSIASVKPINPFKFA